MRLYNTESRQKEELIPLSDETIRLYTCGPTVYNFAHIGNFRTYVFEDFLRRSLQYVGFKVIQAMNITDIDDKTLAGAIRENKTLKEYTDPFTEAFFEDLQTLCVQPVEYYPRATEFVEAMINIIQRLLEKNIAYEGVDGSIYFSIQAFPSYGRLSHLKLGELKIGSSQRVRSDEYHKEDLADFALWKAYDPERDGKIFWESPFGKGRPGWHIECSAMAMSLLGETIDLHVGGVDNMFPHHENEIAQSEAFSEKVFVKHWLHVEHLLVDHKKMSKSLGNFYTLRDLINRGYTGKELRFLLLNAHYRTQLNFTLEGLDAAKSALSRLSDFTERLLHVEGEDHPGQEDLLQKTKQSFTEALSDDLNSSLAFSTLFELVRKVNFLCDQNKVSKQFAKQILNYLHEIDAVLAVIPFTKEIEIPLEFSELLIKREEARKRKDWKEADYFREALLQKGYLIEDMPLGPKLKKK